MSNRRFRSASQKSALALTVIVLAATSAHNHGSLSRGDARQTISAKSGSVTTALSRAETPNNVTKVDFDPSAFHHFP